MSTEVYVVPEAWVDKFTAAKAATDVVVTCDMYLNDTSKYRDCELILPYAESGELYRRIKTIPAHKIIFHPNYRLSYKSANAIAQTRVSVIEYMANTVFHRYFKLYLSSKATDYNPVELVDDNFKAVCVITMLLGDNMERLSTKYDVYIGLIELFGLHPELLAGVPSEDQLNKYLNKKYQFYYMQSKNTLCLDNDQRQNTICIPDIIDDLMTCVADHAFRLGLENIDLHTKILKLTHEITKISLVGLYTLLTELSKNFKITKLKKFNDLTIQELQKCCFNKEQREALTFTTLEDLDTAVKSLYDEAYYTNNVLNEITTL